MNLLRLIARHSVGTMVFSLLALAAISCSKEARRPLSAVRGKVLLAGKPTPGAIVYFHPISPDDQIAGKLAAETILPHGKVGEDGSFQVGTYADTDGAPPGDYMISIQWLGKSKYVTDEEVSLLPPRYLSPQWSGLRAKVMDGPTELPAFVLQY